MYAIPVMGNPTGLEREIYYFFLKVGNSCNSKPLLDGSQIGQIETFQFLAGDANDGVWMARIDAELLEPCFGDVAIPES